MRYSHLRRPVLVAATAILGASGLLLATAVVPTAMATSVGDAQGDVDRLGHDVEVAAEKYNEIQAQIGPLQQQLDVAKTRQADQQRYIDGLKGQMSDLAVSAYKRGGVDPSLAIIISNDPVALVENTAVVEALSRSQVASLGSYSAALSQLQADQATTTAKLVEIQSLEQQAAATKADIEGQLNSAKDVLARAERDKAEREAAALAASRSRTTTSAPAGDTGSTDTSGGGGPVGSGTSCESVGSAAPSGRAAAVLDFACAQLGKPYVWAADGPGSYDCSGFTMASWAVAGVALPHSSRLQYSEGTHVSRSELQPGDLVFFYSPISHVGIYIGNGYMVHAPHTGDVVRVAPLSSGYAGATRL